MSKNKLSNLQTLAASGDVRSIIDLGCLYMFGTHVLKDLNIAKTFFIIASEKGSVEAEFRLASALIAENIQEGIVRLRKLRASGFPPASYELGNCVYIGNLVEKSSAKAISKWREAAKGGHVLAHINALKYELYFAKPFKKPIIIVIYIFLSCKAIWLVSIRDYDLRVMGSTNASLNLLEYYLFNNSRIILDSFKFIKWWAATL